MNWKGEQENNKKKLIKENSFIKHTGFYNHHHQLHTSGKCDQTIVKSDFDCNIDVLKYTMEPRVHPQSFAKLDLNLRAQTKLSNRKTKRRANTAELNPYV